MKTRITSFLLTPPLTQALILGVFILVVENGVMLVFLSLGALEGLNWMIKGLIDFLALVIGVSPALYLHLFRPMDRHLAERRQAEELSTTVFNSSPIGIYVVRDGAFRAVNPQFQKDTGYTEDELLGRDSLSMVLPQYRSMVRVAAVEMLKGRRFTPFEYEVASKSGELKWVMETVASIELGGKRAALGYFMDVTESKRVEEALQQSLEKTAHNRQLLLALGNAAQAIQRSITLKEIYRNILDEVANIGFDASLYTLSDDGEHLFVQATTYRPGVLRQVEELTGTPSRDFRVPVVPGSFSHRIVSEGKTILLDPIHEAVAEVLPGLMRPLAPRFASLLGIQEGVGARLTVEGKPYGMLTITGSGLTGDDVPAVSAFANQISIAIEKTRLFQRAQEMAITDGLTGLYNHRHFIELLAVEVRRASRYRRPVALVMMDLDHFKAVNDTYGHQTGDEALNTLAGILRGAVRETDYVARYGGEEFAIILPESTEQASAAMAERIREAVEGHDFTVQGQLVRITVSLGVAACLVETEDAAQDLIRRADQALYAAKRLGRNRVCVYPGPRGYEETGL